MEKQATLSLRALRRTLKGKKVRQLRKEALLPAVVYGRELSPLLLAVPQSEFEKLFRLAGTSTIFNLQLDGEEHDVLIKELALDPVTSQPRHIDFYQIKKGEKLSLTIPLSFRGEAPAVKELGGVLVTNKKELLIECLPKDLPPEIEVALSLLTSLEATIKIKDIKAPPGVAFLASPEEVVAVVAAPRVEEEAIPVSEEEAVAAVEAAEEAKEITEAETKEAEK